MEMVIAVLFFTRRRRQYLSSIFPSLWEALLLNKAFRSKSGVCLASGSILNESSSCA